MASEHRKVAQKVALIVAAAALVLTGCASTDYNYRPDIQHISRPPLGSVVTIGVGEEMLVQGQLEERDALLLAQDVRVGLLGLYSFTPGHFIRVGGRGAVGLYNESDVVGSGRVQVNPMADPFQVIEYNPTENMICGISIYNLKVCTRIDTAELIRLPVLSDNSFQQTLIYSGRIGNKINIGYREFSGDLARPAFNNDVEYDLSESNIIGYRGAELEIISADNRQITYRVIRNFNEAER